MKRFSKIMALLLVAVLAIGMAACSSYGKVKSAFEKAGYTEVEEMESATAAIKESLEKDADDALALEMHILSKGITFVFVLEFNATDDLIEFYNSSETAQGFVKDVTSNEDVKAFYNALVEAGYANGNCLVFSLINTEEVKDIVRNA